MASVTLPRFRSAAAPQPPAPAFPVSSQWIFIVIGVQVACQLGLLFEFLAPFRVVFRSGAFGINLIALVFAHRARKQPHHPAFWMGVFCLAWLAAQILHPDTNTATSAWASWTLNAAVMAPLFWVPRLRITPQVVRTAILFLWGFHILSSIFGVLQVYFPGERFQPAVSMALRESEMGYKGLSFRDATGEEVLRPMGLTDMPGGAATAGLYAFVFGLGFFALSRGFTWSILGLLTLPLGLFCIYLSQVRVTLVLAIILSIVFALALYATGRLSGAIRVCIMVPIVVAIAFIWAAARGGDATVERFGSLIEDDPNAVYYKNRGRFLEETFQTQLPDYPFGAGLGRWGMVNIYFADRTMPDSTPLYSEIQWTSWLFDGGIMLMMGYALAMGVTIVATARIAAIPGAASLAGWALLIVAYDVAMLAFTFSYPVFAGQTGVEFWLLNAMIWTAAHQMPRRPAWRIG